MTNEVCGNETTTVKNLGQQKQCLESPIKKPFVAKEDFSFSLADFRNKTKWVEAIAAKNIKVLPLVEGITPNNTEPNIKNGRFSDYTLKAGVPGSTYRIDTAICTHEALKTLENSEYTRVFRATTSDEVTCDVQDDESIKGEKLTTLRVGLRTEATDDDVPFTNVDFKYDSENFDILLPGFEINELEDISDLTIEIVSAVAGTITFTVTDKCSNVKKTNLVLANFAVKDASGDAFTINLTGVDANGVYTITPSTGSFANNFTVNLSGVITQVDKNYESTGAATVTGIS